VNTLDLPGDPAYRVTRHTVRPDLPCDLTLQLALANDFELKSKSKMRLAGKRQGARPAKGTSNL
jgi:hypothetical protein